MSRTAADVRQTVVPSSSLLPNAYVGFSIATKPSHSRGFSTELAESGSTVALNAISFASAQKNIERARRIIRRVMGFRFRRRFRMAPNLSKSRASESIGRRAAGIRMGRAAREQRSVFREPASVIGSRRCAHRCATAIPRRAALWLRSRSLRSCCSRLPSRNSHYLSAPLEPRWACLPVVHHLCKLTR